MLFDCYPPTHSLIFLLNKGSKGSRKAKSSRCKSFRRAFSNRSMGFIDLTFLHPYWFVIYPGLTRSRSKLIHSNVNKTIFKYIESPCPRILPFHLVVLLLPLLQKVKLCTVSLLSSGTIKREKERKLPALKMVPTDGNETHLPTPLYGQYLTHAHNHITRAVAAMDRCFALVRVHQHGIAVGSTSRVNPRIRDPLLPKRVQALL